MAVNTLKCNHLTPLDFKGLNPEVTVGAMQKCRHPSPHLYSFQCVNLQNGTMQRETTHHSDPERRQKCHGIRLVYLLHRCQSVTNLTINKQTNTFGLVGHLASA